MQVSVKRQPRVWNAVLPSLYRPLPLTPCAKELNGLAKTRRIDGFRPGKAPGCHHQEDVLVPWLTPALPMK